MRNCSSDSFHYLVEFLVVSYVDDDWGITGHVYVPTDFDLWKGAELNEKCAAIGYLLRNLNVDGDSSDAVDDIGVASSEPLGERGGLRSVCDAYPQVRVQASQNLCTYFWMNTRKDRWTELLAQSSSLVRSSRELLYVWQEIIIDLVAYLWWDREQARFIGAFVLLGHSQCSIGRVVDVHEDN